VRKSKGQIERESRQYYGLLSDNGNTQLMLKPKSKKAQRKKNGRT